MPDKAFPSFLKLNPSNRPPDVLFSAAGSSELLRGCARMLRLEAPDVVRCSTENDRLTGTSGSELLALLVSPKSASFGPTPLGVEAFREASVSLEALTSMGVASCVAFPFVEVTGVLLEAFTLGLGGDLLEAFTSGRAGDLLEAFTSGRAGDLLEAFTPGLTADLVETFTSGLAGGLLEVASAGRSGRFLEAFTSGGSGSLLEVFASWSFRIAGVSLEAFSLTGATAASGASPALTEGVAVFDGLGSLKV